MTEPVSLAVRNRWQPPQDLLDRHDARVLRPAEALRLDGDDGPLDTTVYRAHEILVPAAPILDERDLSFARFLAGTLAELGIVAEQLGVDRGPDGPAGLAAFRTELLADGLPPRVVALRLIPAPPPGLQPDRPIDAWEVLQRLRLAANAGKRARRVRHSMELNHLLFADAGDFGGTPITHPHSVDRSAAANAPDLTGRVPLTLVLPEPPRTPRAKKERTWRRAVVAVLDTGCGEHPWLRTGDAAWQSPDPVVCWDLPAAQDAGGNLVPPTSTAAEARARTLETDGCSVEPLLRSLDEYAGHGTFIAGLIRQAAPDVTIRAVRIMEGDGVAYASNLVNALDRILRAAPGETVDVVSLSLGAYWELIDPDYRESLADVVRDLGDAGIVVVASAGNDATLRPKYPAGFAGEPGYRNVVSVGALNPNGTRAAFSNDGDWVTAWAPGVALVSTLPVTLRGSANPTLSSLAREGQVARDSTDPDDYGLGFARWSGTSFAAPLVAAEVARQLMTKPKDLLATTSRRRLGRAARAIEDARTQIGRRWKPGG